MLKKILWFILIVLICYIVFVFVSPENADNLWEKLWIKTFNEKIRSFKTTTDDIYTNLPSQEEFKDLYEKTLSWAEKTKNDAIDWANKIKDKVDDIRENLNDSKKKYEDLKDSVNKTQEQIEAWIDAIKAFSWILSTWSTSE